MGQKVIGWVTWKEWYKVWIYVSLFCLIDNFLFNEISQWIDKQMNEIYMLKVYNKVENNKTEI